ncbi:MAG: hypothetical protein LUH11_02590 [Candidatus Gastranaerophilales bacterium]|nr:hypothetical protein [Candidatus Gastranaerophilales bacterium]
MTVLYSIIHADGFKSGLWPISGDMLPNSTYNNFFKQAFLNTASIIDDKNIITLTCVSSFSDIKNQLKFLQEKFCRKSEYKIISEPVSKKTAPSVSLAVKYIDKLNFSSTSPVILYISSSQFIINREKFFSIIEKGIKLAKAGFIVTFASETNEINEDFCYLKARKNPQISEIEQSALKVSAFIANPKTKTQKENLKGRLLINSGIYMFNAETYFTELQKSAPEIYNQIIAANLNDSIPSISIKEYEKIPDMSIECALMEKSRKLAVIPINDDNSKNIDSWNALYDILNKDEKGNCFIGKTVDLDSENSMVYSSSKTIATLGLKNILVAQTEDAVTVIDRKNIGSVKKIYKKLNAKNKETKNIHKTVYCPWGYYNILEKGDGFLTKCITVNPNGKLSIQLHNNRSEHWLILEGEAAVLKGKDIIKLKSGESIDIDVKEIHSLLNAGKEQLKILEIQQGEILDENDIERLEDIYGRV